MKQKVNPSDIGVDVKNLIKTKKSELLIRIKNGSEKMEELKKAVSEKVPEVKVTRLVNKKAVHVKDIDESVTDEEIREAISQSIHITVGSIELSNLRPTYEGRQNITVKLVKKDVEKLIELQRIKIGWPRESSM